MTRDTAPQEFSPLIDEYGYYYDENGERKFGVVGQKDIYAEIQRHKSESDFEFVKQYLFDNFNGKEVKGVYGERPKEISDVNDIISMVEETQQLYMQLPENLRAKYTNIYELVNNFDEKDLEDLQVNNIAPAPVVSRAESNQGGNDNEVK